MKFKTLKAGITVASISMSVVASGSTPWIKESKVGSKPKLQGHNNHNHNHNHNINYAYNNSCGLKGLCGMMS